MPLLLRGGSVPHRQVVPSHCLVRPSQLPQGGLERQRQQGRWQDLRQRLLPLGRPQRPRALGLWLELGLLEVLVAEGRWRPGKCRVLFKDGTRICRRSRRYICVKWSK